VFARTIGVPNSMRAATGQLVGSLAARSLRRIGLGNGNGRRFLFHLGAGFDAEVIEQVERHAWLKRSLAHPTFAVAALTTFFRGFDRTHPAYRVEADGKPFGDGFFAIISNTSPYAFFGVRPLTVTDAAGLGRGLAITMFQRLEPGVLLPAAFSAMARGRRLQHHADILQGADLVSLELVAHGSPFPWQVDGDYLGEVERLQVRYEPDSLTLVVPGDGAETATTG